MAVGFGIRDEAVTAVPLSRQKQIPIQNEKRNCFGFLVGS
jgi:hypothetical protein